MANAGSAGLGRKVWCARVSERGTPVDTDASSCRPAGDRPARRRYRRERPLVERRDAEAHQPERGRCSRRLDPCDRVDRSHHHHRAGESLLRSLLRDVPRCERDPDAARRHTEDLHTGLGARALLAPVPQHDPVPARRPARSEGLDHRSQRRQDERLRDLGEQGQGQVRRRNQRFTAACRPFLGPAPPAGRPELPHGQGDPELLGVREALPPAGSHVRARGLLDPAVASVPVLRMVGALPRPDRPDELPFEHRSDGPARAVPLRRVADLRVDRHHLPAGQGRRQLEVYVGEGHLRAGPVHPEGREVREDAVFKSPLPGFVDASTAGSSATSPRTRRSSVRRAAARSRPCRGSCRATSRASTRGRARRSEMGRRTSRGS